MRKTFSHITRRLTAFVAMAACFTIPAHAQELNAKVTINRQQISNTTEAVFEALQNSLTAFINERQWTDMQYEEKERINCTFSITLKTYSDTDNSFTGTIFQDGHQSEKDRHPRRHETSCRQRQQKANPARNPPGSGSLRSLPFVPVASRQPFPAKQRPALLRQRLLRLVRMATLRGFPRLPTVSAHRFVGKRLTIYAITKNFTRL